MKISKKIFLFSLSSLLVVGTILPISVTTILSKFNNNVNNKTKYKFNDLMFDNKNDLFNYAKNIANYQKYDIKNNEKWSIDFGNQTLFFSNINELFNFLEQKMVMHKANTSSNIELGIDGSINYQDLIKLNLNDKNLNTTNIFRGKDNSYYLSENEAKDSYLQIHDTYFFDGIFFRTKEELRAYLDINYEKINNSSNKNIVIKSPTGETSLPMDLQKIIDKDSTELNKLISFVNLYAKKYLQVKVNINNDVMFKYFNNDDLNNNISEILTYFDDPSFININSNQGKPNFLIDLNKEDEFDLFGPYYTQASASIMSITNPDAWTRVEGDSWNFNDNQKISMLLSNFMDFILYEDDSFPYPFGLDEIKNETKKYFDYLQNNYPYVYDSVVSLYQTMKSGKRYSSFYKLPILYIKTIEDLIFLSADQNIIEITRQYYKKVAQCFDDRLYSLIPKKFLMPNVVGGKYKMLSFVDLFNIDNKTFDLNTDVESFVDVIILQYSKFVNLLEFLPAPVFFSSYLPGVYNFSENLVRFINKNFIFENDLRNEYEYVWNIFNMSNKTKFEESINNLYLENTNKKLNTKTFEVLSCNFIMKKEVFINNVVNSIETDLINFSNNIFNHQNNSFFYGMPNSVIDSFLNLYKMNNNKVDFRVFAILKVCYLYNIIKNKLGMINFFVFKPFLYNNVNETRKIINYSFNFFNNKNNDYVTKNIASIFGSDFLKNLTSIEGVDLSPWEVYESSYSFISEFNNLFSQINEAIDFITDFDDFFAFVPYINIALLVLDFLVPKVNKFSYYFECEDTKYIWNGGSETKVFFGLITAASRDISSMKINEPLQITNQHLNNAYYYNGKEYFDLNSLKRDQLIDILSGRFFYNDSIKPVYSFNNLKFSNINTSNKTFSSIGTLDFENNDLMDYVYKCILNNDRDIIIDNVYTYANGFTFDPNISKIKNIEEILKNIKHTKVAIKPILNDKNMPISNNSNIDDGSIPSYVLPGKSWTSSGGFSYNSIDNYVILDPNTKNNSQLYDTNNSLKESFYKEFDVPSKTILETDLYSKNNFSDYLTNINSYYVYEVILDNGYKRFFKDKSIALKWFLSNCNFKVYSTTDKLEYYFYDNNVFYNLESYLEWVLKNSEVVNEQ